MVWCTIICVLTTFDFDLDMISSDDQPGSTVLLGRHFTRGPQQRPTQLQGSRVRHGRMHQRVPVFFYFSLTIDHLFLF